MIIIENIENTLENELNIFWNWAGKIPEQFATNNIYNDWEVEYPGWDSLIIYFKNAIKSIRSGYKSEKLIGLMLEVIAIDHEGESLVHESFEVLDDSELVDIIKCSISHMQKDVRWQIASIIGEKKKSKWRNYLLEFIRDDDIYVRGRALLALNEIDIEEASRIALVKIKDDHDYLRKISLDILYRAGHENLGDVIKLLEGDESYDVQLKVREIKNQIGDS